MSWELSFGVPRNRWSGQTHGGKSHVWQTNMPLGIAPLLRVHEMRCAAMFIHLLATLTHITPYPAPRVAPIQNQQSSVFSTYDQKRSISAGVSSISVA